MWLCKPKKCLNKRTKKYGLTIFFIIFLFSIFFVSFVFSNEFSGISFELDSNLIESSRDLVGEISIDPTYNFGTISLIIFYENGAMVYKEYIILKEEKLIWNYYDLGDLPEGKYIAVLRIVTHDRVLKDFKQEFEIRKKVRGITGGAINFVQTSGKTYGSIFALILSLIFLWFVIRKTKSRVVRNYSIVRKKVKRIKARHRKIKN